MTREVDNYTMESTRQPKVKGIKLKKALSVNNVINQKIQRIQLSTSFQEAFGSPQNFGVWFIWGPSGSGKSTFVMQLAKELAYYAPTLHDTLEEETDDAEFIDRMNMLNMQDVKDNHHSVSYGAEEMDEYLTRNKYKHKTIIIDSAHYFFNNFKEYLAFKRKWVTGAADAKNRKILVLTGSADGKLPDKELLKEIMRDAKMKIFVSGYAAYCKGRTIGPNGGQYIIYPKGYEELQGIGSSAN